MTHPEPACARCGHPIETHTGFMYPPSAYQDTEYAGSVSVCTTPDCACPCYTTRPEPGLDDDRTGRYHP